MWVGSRHLRFIWDHWDRCCTIGSYLLWNLSGNHHTECVRYHTLLRTIFLHFLSSRTAAFAWSFNIFSSCARQCMQVFWCLVREPGLSQHALHGDTHGYRPFIPLGTLGRWEYLRDNLTWYVVMGVFASITATGDTEEIRQSHRSV